VSDYTRGPCIRPTFGTHRLADSGTAELSGRICSTSFRLLACGGVEAAGHSQYRPIAKTLSQTQRSRDEGQDNTNEFLARRRPTLGGLICGDAAYEMEDCTRIGGRVR
jgi:hypothetical protein